MVFVAQVDWVVPDISPLMMCSKLIFSDILRRNTDGSLNITTMMNRPCDAEYYH